MRHGWKWLAAIFLIATMMLAPLCSAVFAEEIESASVEATVDEAVDYGDTGLFGEGDPVPQSEVDTDIVGMLESDNNGEFESKHAVMAEENDFTTLKYKTYNDLSAILTGYEGAGTRLSIPTTVTFDGDDAIYRVTGIGESAFSGCSTLETLIIPASVNYIGRLAFRDCVNLTNVVIEGNIQNLIEATSSFYDRYGAFYNTGTASGGYTVSFSEGVTDIPANLFNTASDRIKNNYAHVTAVIFPNSVEQIGNQAFRRCYALKSIKWGTSLRSIGEYAFDSDGKLSSLKLPPSITSVGIGAFGYCTGLENITLPSSLNFLGREAFRDCVNLTSLVIKGNIQNMDNVSSNWGTYSGVFYNTGTSSGGYKVAFSKGVTDIPKNLFNTISGRISNKYAHVTEVTFADSVNHINTNAFNSCYSLTTVRFGKGLSSISEGAFANCEALNKVVYNSTEEAWQGVSINSSSNHYLVNAEVFFKTIPATGITLNKSSMRLAPGKTATLKATVKPADATNKKVKWTSSNTKVATVKNGKITAKKAGVATITATAAGGKNVLVKCTVIVSKSAVASKSLKKLNSNVAAKLNLGKKLYVLPTYANKKGWKISGYTSSNKNVATVTSSGVVTPKKAGKAKITATEANGKKFYFQLTVVDPTIPTGISLNKTETVTLKVGKTLTLKATMTPSTAVSALNWTSTDETVATVSKKGKVKAVKEGMAFIIVNTENGKTALVTIQVVK